MTHPSSYTRFTIIVIAAMLIAAPLGLTVSFNETGVVAGQNSPNYVEISGETETIEVWERAGLPLRADTDDSATAVDNTVVYVDPENRAQRAIDRETLAVYPPGDVTVTFDRAFAANTTQFAGDEVSVITGYLEPGTETDDFEFDLTPGSFSEVEQLLSADTRDELNQSITFERLTTDPLADDGALTVDVEADDSGQYLVMVTRTEDGEVFTIDNGNVDVVDNTDGEILGAEVFSVHQRNSDIDVPSVVAKGDSVDVDASTEIDGQVNHAVALYNETTFVTGNTTLELTESIENLNTSDIDIEHSIDAVNGVADSTDVEVAGVDFEKEGISGDIQGTTQLSDIIAFITDPERAGVETPATTPTDDTVWDASANITDGTAEETIPVGTESDFDAGKYRVIHIASAQGNNLVNFETNTTTVRIGSAGEIDPDNNVATVEINEHGVDQVSISNLPDDIPETAKPVTAPLDQKPADTPDPSNEDVALYLDIEITTEGGEDVQVDEPTEVSTTVEREQLGNIAPNDAVLVHYVDGQWQERPTEAEVNDDGTVTLTAETTGLSPFAIAERTVDDDTDGDDGGGGGGGGGGGVAPSPTTPSTIDSPSAIIDRFNLPADAQPTVAEVAKPVDGSVSFVGQTNVMSVTLEGTNAVANPEVGVVTFDTRPVDVPEAPGRTGTLALINVPGPAGEDPGTVQMRVYKSTLEATDASADDVRIARYDASAGEWAMLDTEIISETDNSVLVRAQTPRFSYFATVLVTDDTATDEPANETEEPDEDRGTPGFGLSVAIVALLGAALLARHRR